MKELLAKMKINTFTATILGLISVGFYWVFLLKEWLKKHKEYKERMYSNRLNNADRNKLIKNLKVRTRKTLKLVRLIKVLLLVGISVFLTEMVSELYFNKILFPEEPFWFFVWLVFSLFALLLASLAVLLRQTLLDENIYLETPDESRKPWLLKGGGKRIYILAILNIILALGLLPFIIFPPILSSAMNKYIEIEETRILTNSIYNET